MERVTKEELVFSEWIPQDGEKYTAINGSTRVTMTTKGLIVESPTVETFIPVIPPRENGWGVSTTNHRLYKGAVEGKYGIMYKLKAVFLDDDFECLTLKVTQEKADYSAITGYVGG